MYSEVVEVDCRVIPVLEGKCELGNQAESWDIVQGNTGEKFYVTKQLVFENVRKILLEVKQRGIESISVVLAHSYAYFEQELAIGKIAEDIGEKDKVVEV